MFGFFNFYSNAGAEAHSVPWKEAIKIRFLKNKGSEKGVVRIQNRWPLSTLKFKLAYSSYQSSIVGDVLAKRLFRDKR